MSISQAPWRRQTQTGVREPIRKHENNKGARSLFRAPFIDGLKFRRLPEFMDLWEGVRADQGNQNQ